MERIYVTYKPVSGTVAWATHLAIHYIDSNGTHYISEAYPKIPQYGLDAASALIREEYYSNLNDDSEYGTVVAQNTPYEDFDNNLPQEDIITGEDLSTYWNEIQTYKNYVNNYGFEYRPLSQNSNSYVGGALDFADLPQPTGVDEEGMGHLIPGHGEGLNDPLDPYGNGDYDPFLGHEDDGNENPDPENSLPHWYDPQNPFDSPPIDPLVLDLNGNGLDIIDLGSSSAYFDLDGNGFAEHTAWIGPQDGFLVRDLNANGQIDGIIPLASGKNM
jgi:hypothetical protein